MEQQLYYVNAKTPIVIICKIHGEFKQTPDKHIQGQGCRECGKSKQGHRGKKAALLFISKSQEIHGKNIIIQILAILKAILM